MTSAESPDLAPDILSRDDPYFWLYGSGTTGSPKGAIHLQHDMIVAADRYARPILKRSATLDLSLGNLHHHFIGRDTVKKLEALDLAVDTSSFQDEGEWRFIAVSE